MLPPSIIEDEERLKFKIIILGRGGVGKTKLFVRYKDQVYQDQGQTTLCIDAFEMVRNDVSYVYYDTTGQERFDAIVNSYYRGADAAIIVYDVTNIESPKDLKKYKEKVDELIPHAKVYVVGAKCDLESVVEQNVLHEIFPGEKIHFTSAKTNQNVTEFFRLVEDDLFRKYGKSKKQQSNKV